LLQQQEQQPQEQPAPGIIPGTNPPTTTQKKQLCALVLWFSCCISLAISVGGDAFDKILLIQAVQEKSPSGTIIQASFIYETFEKYVAK
jgi:hypothetical protein